MKMSAQDQSTEQKQAPLGDAPPKDVLNAVAMILKEWPESINLLRAMVKVQCKEQTHWTYPWEGFTYLDFPGWNPWDLARVLRTGILECVSPDSKRNAYRLADLTAAEKAIEAFKDLVPVVSANGDVVRGPLEVSDDLFDEIVGYEDLKKHFLKALRGGIPVHCLLWGVPGSAKTMFMTALERLDGALFVPMSTATKAGLAQALMEHRPRILLVDEVDKCSREDISVLLTLMEQGFVKETKCGRSQAKVYVNSYVFMACNDVRHIDPALLDRPQPFYFKAYTREQFTATVVAVLKRRFDRGPELAEYVALRAWADLGYRNVRAALNIGKVATSKADVDEQVQLLMIYRKE